MLPDEKYPDASLHPVSSSGLYGELQKGNILIIGGLCGRGPLIYF